MKRIFTRSPPRALLALSLFGAPTALAQCTRSPRIDSGCDPCGVGTALGRVNLTSTYLQPVGTPLGTSVFDLTSGTRYPDPNKVLYECDAGDAGQIYEVFATNGDDRAAYYDLGAQTVTPTTTPPTSLRRHPPDPSDSGKVFTRYWQSAPITRHATVGSKIRFG